jgi:hypothetical protein
MNLRKWERCRHEKKVPGTLRAGKKVYFARKEIKKEQ